MASSLDNGEKQTHPRRSWRTLFTRNPATTPDEDRGDRPPKWSMGILNDKFTHQVPGSVLLLTNPRKEPLSAPNAPPDPSAPSTFPPSDAGKKTTRSGSIVLDPQPDDSPHDPLNWPGWRRDAALLSLGFYCMVGGGMTPILAAGFTDVAATFDVSVPRVALTTGLYMMGMGVGAVVASPTAILYGKRPVYLGSCVLFVATSVWCAAARSYPSLVAARVMQGVAVSPVECLPSATIAEIFFLHERAYRIGVYTLLLLGGKNLVPLVSAVIINALDWRWVFWIVAMVVGFCWFLLFFFVPETFWDRTPRPKSRTPRPTSRMGSRLPTVAQLYHRMSSQNGKREGGDAEDEKQHDIPNSEPVTTTPDNAVAGGLTRPTTSERKSTLRSGFSVDGASDSGTQKDSPDMPLGAVAQPSLPTPSKTGSSQGEKITAPVLSNQSSHIEPNDAPTSYIPDIEQAMPADPPHNRSPRPLPLGRVSTASTSSIRKPRSPTPPTQPHTTLLQTSPGRTFVRQLRPYSGRLHPSPWLRAALRPFILVAYPAVLWSAITYSCSIGWLIVLSEAVAAVYRDARTYGFSALGTGLVYLSPFVGGVLGTVVAGRVSDVVVRAMARRNGGVYEPEFRLVMVLPVAVTTGAGLMGFGWSAQVGDHWIVPTVFFGMVSFGCSLGGTTAIAFCVDSYREYAGEALVTLSFCKNVFHGLVFSLFVNEWLQAKGAREVFLALGGIQLGLLALTVPMYVWGKRARMWTVRMNLMERF